MMRNAEVAYLLTAMAENACEVAIDARPDYAGFAMFAKIVGRLHPVITRAESNLDAELNSSDRKKLKRIFYSITFGELEWYSIALHRLLEGRPVELNEFQKADKLEFDSKYVELAGEDVPDLSG